MSQIVGQDNQTGGVDETYMTSIGNIVLQKGKVTDVNAIGATKFKFQDSGLRKTDSPFSVGTTYYLHAKIKRMKEIQDFRVKLLSSNASQTATQFILPVSITPAVKDTEEEVIKEYVDVEFLFTPLLGFDIIVFELDRDTVDTGYKDKDGNIIGRTPAIAFIELSRMENKSPVSKSLKKIGLQSHPDFVFCINNEEFHLPQSGIFELRDGIVDINFFSVVEGAILQNEESVLSSQMNNNETINVTNSPKEPREIDAFTLDYMYNTETEG